MLGMKRQHTANSMVEYTLPVAIVVVVLIVALASSGINLKTALVGLFQGSTSSQEQDTLKLQKWGQNPYTQMVEIQLEDGTIVRLDKYPKDLGKLVETEGTNGTTEILLENLRTVAQQLLEQGKITQQQYNEFETLANQGHRIADIEQTLELSASRSGSDIQSFMKTSLEFGGSTYTNPYDLAVTIDTNDLPSLKNDDLFNFLSRKGFAVSPNEAGAGPEIVSFLETYRSLDRNGALTDPALEKVVMSLTEQIRLIADHTTNNLDILINNHGDLGQLNTAVASSTSHSYSANICSSGGGRDSGIHCPQGKS